ncbi:MAG TPA: hypothetical protein VFF24_09015, partial [Acidimicrobiia bacterium]|nr:hypothetical protein [Acidimicrobiia bacterium]
MDAAAMALADVPPWTGPVQPPPATWQPNLPGTPPDARTLRATMIPRGRAREGPHARVVVSPGALALERRDLARAERAAERARAARERDQELAAAAYLATGEWPDPPAPRRVVERWSRRSRARMTRALAELDYAPLLRRGVVPAMVTLTYPGDWLTVAGDGPAVKRHLRMLGKRWFRAWGTPLVGVWKLEFQARGAPHFHLFTVPPQGEAGGLNFKHWLSVTWADIVAHPDPVQYLNHLAAGTGIDYGKGLRYRDPKRISVYFTKHGTF